MFSFIEASSFENWKPKYLTDDEYAELTVVFAGPTAFPRSSISTQHKIRLGLPLKQETKATSCRVPPTAAF